MNSSLSRYLRHLVSSRSRSLVVLAVLFSVTAIGCGGADPPPVRSGASPAPTTSSSASPSSAPGSNGAGTGRPCFVIRGESELRPRDAARVVDELAAHITLAPQDEALRRPRSLDDIKTAIRRDVVYVFPDAAKYARGLDSTEGRFAEAQLELLLGESQLVAAQVLNAQEAWVGNELRTARANLAGESDAAPVTDRLRMLAQLVRVVEEGNRISDALGIVAPGHLRRGAEVIRSLRQEAPNDVRTFALSAEYHRLRGEWAEFETAMRSAEAAEKRTPPICYLRAMEQVERHRKTEEGVRALRECLKAYPRFVRAQAAIVQLATNAADGLREMDTLRRMNPDHYLVMLLEPTLMADQELTRMQAHAAGK